MLMWGAAAAVLVYSLLKGYAVWHSALDASTVGIAAVVAARSAFSLRVRSLACSFGLMTAAAMAVHLAGGITEAHFTFFVVVVLLTLYEDWTVFVLAVVYTLLHHGVGASLDPAQVFASHPDDPWTWAAIHAAFVAAGGAAGVVAWQLNADVRRRMAQTQEELRVAATTDSLTGLANRRQLTTDLARAVGDAQARLALYDLDGFKTYNDTFGHMAGDALLARLGRRLREAVADGGMAYRLGGDEFCVLATGPDSAETVESGTVALSERGSAFAIDSSHGVVVLHGEVKTSEDAMRLADQRMYDRKNGGRRSAGEQSSAVLMRVLSARNPDLMAHSADVSRMAELVARRLGVAEEHLNAISRAAELHDVGKVGIPDAILDKPLELDGEEWGFMRRHTIIGERIIAGAPALAEASRLVRSSHERWDGDGYPDGLAGEAIPIGSRIIAVCDAFDAMRAERAYNPARGVSMSLAELRRCSGTQFDSAVVDAFCLVTADELATGEPVPA